MYILHMYILNIYILYRYIYIHTEMSFNLYIYTYTMLCIYAKVSMVKQKSEHMYK